MDLASLLSNCYHTGQTLCQNTMLIHANNFRYVAISLCILLLKLTIGCGYLVMILFFPNPERKVHSQSPLLLKQSYLFLCCLNQATLFHGSRFKQPYFCICWQSLIPTMRGYKGKAQDITFVCSQTLHCLINFTSEIHMHPFLTQIVLISYMKNKL